MSENAEKHRIFEFITNAAKSVCSLVWPLRCTLCGDYDIDFESQLCLSCSDKLLQNSAGEFCSRCGRDIGTPDAITNKGCPKCFDEAYYFDQIARVGVYSDLMRSSILQFKSFGREELSPFLATYMRSVFMGTFGNETDCIVPVPIHWGRRLKRGYNQSRLLASAINADIPVVNCLKRVRRTEYQSGLSNRKRIKNLQNAFAIKNYNQIRNMNVCLIDDIKTTGATLNECALILKQAGANKVFALVIAVAHQD